MRSMGRQKTRKIRTCLASLLVISPFVNACSIDINPADVPSFVETDINESHAIFANFFGEFTLPENHNVASLVFLAPKEDVIWKSLSDVALVGARSASITEFKIEQGDEAGDLVFGTLFLTIETGKAADTVTVLELTLGEQRSYVTIGEIKTTPTIEGDSSFVVEGSYPALEPDCSATSITLRNISKSSLTLTSIESNTHNVGKDLYSPAAPYSFSPGEKNRITLNLQCNTEDGSFYTITPLAKLVDENEKPKVVSLYPISVGYTEINQSKLDTIISHGNKLTQ